MKPEDSEVTVDPFPLAVVKVGGSLFDLPQLGSGLRRWLAERSFARALLIPGGGPLAEAIRRYHRIHRLDEEPAHWLAVRAMQLNAALLQIMLPGCSIVDHPAAMLRQTCAILDAYSFCRVDEGNEAALPHSWQVTSDSIAARVARVGNATRLVMLKSIDLPHPFDWKRIAEAGGVDHTFDSVVAEGGFDVEWIHFRKRLHSGLECRDPLRIPEHDG